MGKTLVEIPNAFGGFAPFPNTIMIPTMGLQSAVIGYRFGFGYEQGKRAVRKMSNEEFNNLDEEAEQAMFKRHDSSAINYFKTEMHNWVALQNLIIEKSVEIEVMKAQRTPSAFREMFEGFTLGFSEQQKADAGKFFASLADPIMKIMSWFSGHKAPSIPVPPPVSPQQPFPPTNPGIGTPGQPPQPVGDQAKLSTISLWSTDFTNGGNAPVQQTLNVLELTNLKIHYTKFIETLQDRQKTQKRGGKEHTISSIMINRMIQNITEVNRAMRRL